MDERLERDVRVARTNVERDIARIGEAFDRQVSNKAVALTAAAAGLGLVIGFGGAKAIKMLLLAGIAGSAATVIVRKKKAQAA